MNKLVSRNPVQRFKEGKKIVKAQGGFKTRDDGVIVNSAGIPVGRSIMGSSYEYEKSFPEDKLILPGLYQDKNTKELFSPYNMDSDGNYNQVISGPSPIQNGTYYETKDASGKIIDRGRYFGGKKLSLPIGSESKKSSQNNSNQKITNTPNQKTANNKQSTHKINKLNRKISNPGAYHNITIWQNKLKNFYAPGTFKVDGIWGKNTEAAYQKYLSIKNIPHEENLIQIPEPTTITPIIQPTPEAKAAISGLDYSDKFKYPEMNVSIPKNYVPTSLKANRSDIREVIRRATGKGAYDFTGAQRKALRQYINGEQYNADDLAAFGNLDIFNAYKPGFYKQGGNMLPSRNIVKRFKLQKGNKLPNAPKAEDRFKNGVRDSAAYLGVPGKDNSYFGESIKRVTTPDNAAIQRQILFRHYPYDNDTIYTEVPEHTKRLSIFPQVNIIPRKGFSFAQTPEYEILKRRFNTAWNLAK